MVGVVSSERTQRALRTHLDPIMNYFDDPKVEDISVNPDGSIHINCRGIGSLKCGVMEAGDRSNIINLVAAYNNTICNAERPFVEAILPFREARFQGLISPMVSAPAFSIRLRPQTIYTLRDYWVAGILTSTQREVLSEAVRSYRNILLVGGTGSGKTTLLNALLSELAVCCPNDRVVSIEDTPELQCGNKDHVDLLSSETVSMAGCLRAALRLRPKRIIVGEVRGAEALDLLKAYNTGHPGGLATVHANDAVAGLERLEALAREATEAPQQRFIASTINLVVFIKPIAIEPYRKVSQILRVCGYKNNEYIFEEASL